MSAVGSSTKFSAVVMSPQRLPNVIELSDSEVVAPSVRIAETSFADSGAGDWLGVYHWLRSPQGNVIGVRQWIDEFSTFRF